MRKELIDSVESIVSEELNIALQKFGEFKNNHEAYAVMKEEIEEAEEELIELNTLLRNYWYYVKINSSTNAIHPKLKYIRKHAINMACEAIQVAAMAEKALRIENKNILEDKIND